MNAREGTVPAAIPSISSPIRAARIGRQAAHYLSAKSRSGTVVSAFRNGINLLLDEADDPALVSVQTAQAPFHPWALAADVAEPLPIGDLTSAGPHCIRFRSGFSIDLSNADVADLRIAPYTSDDAACAHSRLPLLKETLCEGDRDPFQSQIGEVLEDWRKNCDSEALAHLVGLGAGSTPSGDDVLVGILASLTVTADLLGEARLVQVQYAVRKALAASSTPLGSAQMIAAAIDRSFPEPLLDLVTALGDSEVSDVLRRKIDRVRQLGASSGRGMLVGLSVALAAGSRT